MTSEVYAQLVTRRREVPLRGKINPTRSSARLMRQVSALGMEDPVFRNTKDETDASNNHNIFDDMGFTDLPSDMMDMMSIASDPTAVKGKGLDEAFMEMNLPRPNGLRRIPSLVEHSSYDHPDGSFPKMEDTSNSSYTANAFSLVRENSAPSNFSKRKLGIKQTSGQMIGGNHGGSLSRRSGTPRHLSASAIHKKPDFLDGNDHPVHMKNSNCRVNKEQWKGSNPSMNLKEVFTGSRRTVGSGKMDQSSRSRDTLLAEAAMALEQQGQTFVNSSLIEMAKSQRSNNLSDSIYVTDSVSTDEPKERRVLPTLSGLFRQEI
jgi:hypothetical protein